jgi:N6-L-threonylcarbamoyladenine synthase
VAANTLLRDTLASWGQKRGLEVRAAPLSLCTDNAAMGAIAWERLDRGESDPLDLDITPGRAR